MALSRQQRELLEWFRSPLYKDRRGIPGAGVTVESLDQAMKDSQRRRTLNALIRLGYIEQSDVAYAYVLTERGAQAVNCGETRIVGRATAEEPTLV